jgi:signal transduction histidine kinase
LGSIVIFLLKPKQDQQEATESEVGTLKTEVTHLSTAMTDLNEKVEHYSERISDQEKEIERLGATAQRILNNVNHELRLPVGNVMNFAEMLHEGLGKFNETQLKTLSDEVYKNSNRLSSMIMNMLDLAALNAKKLELDKKTINLGELVTDRVNNCRKIYLEDKKIDFVLKIHPEIFVSVDPNYMRQVVDNLVINAIKFSDEGIINVTLLKQKKHIEFVISDSGIGIPQEDIYDIFTPFKMGSNTESKAEGRGVGLALCKAAIEAHGGVITVDSKGGKGAIFKFVL